MLKQMMAGVLAATLSGAAAWAGPAQAADAEWRTVSTTRDVDGDGRADVVRLRSLGNARCALLVRTATGERDVVVTRSEFNPCVWKGAGSVDRRPGAELNVVTLAGAHTSWSTLLTWRDASLTRERYPSADGRWMTDGAVNSVAGWKRVQTPRGLRMVGASVFSEDGRHFQGTREWLALRHGSWTRLARVHVTMGRSGAGQTWGWHVPGFSR